MKENQFTWVSFFNRFCFAAVLVFASYNPAGLSYYHWAFKNILNITPIMALTGLVLLIGWTVFIRATIRSLGIIGITLAFALFGVLFWMIIDWGVIPADSAKAMTYVTQIILCFILATGMSWSHVRRRISGQVDADDIDN